MTKSSLYLNAIRDSFVKYLDKENLKNFCISRSKDFSDTNFTRNRVFSLPVLVGFILSPRVKSLVIDTADYLHGLNLEIASGAAFSKRRTRIPADYIHQMHYGLVSNIYSKGLAPTRWHGHLLLAADGTTYSLPDTEPMAEKFLAGRKTGKTNQPLARGVVIKDVLNDIVIDANMECYGDDEIMLSLKLLKKLPKVVRDLSPVVIYKLQYRYPCCHGSRRSAPTSQTRHQT